MTGSHSGAQECELLTALLFADFMAMAGAEALEPETSTWYSFIAEKEVFVTNLMQGSVGAKTFFRDINRSHIWRR